MRQRAGSYRREVGERIHLQGGGARTYHTFLIREECRKIAPLEISVHKLFYSHFSYSPRSSKYVFNTKSSSYVRTCVPYQLGVIYVRT